MPYQHAVTASEIYNSRLEHHLETSLSGISFVDRGRPDAGKRPVRELAGMDPRLAAVWSTRAEAITGKLGQMSADFQARHGREPSPKELWRMAEEATLSTRGGKHHARSRAEQRQDWRTESEQVLGSAAAVEAMVARMLSAPAPEREPVDPGRVAAAVVDVMAEQRATWQANHIRAEAVRQLRGRVSPAAWTDTLREVVAVALGDELSIPRRVVDHAPVAAGLTRSDGTSIYVRAGSTKYTSPAIVAAEQRLLAAAQLDGGQSTHPIAHVFGDYRDVREIRTEPKALNSSDGASGRMHPPHILSVVTNPAAKYGRLRQINGAGALWKMDRDLLSCKSRWERLSEDVGFALDVNRDPVVLRNCLLPLDLHIDTLAGED